MARRLPTGVQVGIGVASSAVAMAFLVRGIDGDALRSAGTAMLDAPGAVAVALAAFAAAFVLRAWAWTRVLPRLQFGHALAAIHLALGANHVLPLRLGEPMRVVSVVRRTRASTDPIGLEPATASTVTLRAADLVAIGVIGLVLGPRLFADLLGVLGAGALVVVAAVGAAGVLWLHRLRRRLRGAGAGAGERHLRLPGPGVAALALTAWVLEAVLVWQSAHFVGLPVGFGQALLVTTVAVAAQTVAIAPSGLGTYEAASAAAYGALGFDPALGLAAALVAHALKTAYSLIAGAVALVHPAPGLVGRFRLPRQEGPSDRRGDPIGPDVPSGPLGRDLGPARRDVDGMPGPAPAPVVLFLPAHDEVGTVAAVVARAPAAVAGHPVRVLVVDDGSGDGTAEAARSAGAEVVSFPDNRGLGAAVQAGLAWSVAQGAAAVAFCDADGEYAPEELGQVVAPILTGSADYVVGSRFAGTIHRMRRHRRLGNLVLTALVRFVTRRPVTDGQSGYRALAPAAAAEAEIVHDFNYAQVLTIDLLAKGYRYAEVPISYRFREHGRSFIRLGPYLRAVVPAMWRCLNRPASDRAGVEAIGAGA